MSQTPQGQPISRNLPSEICSSLYLSNPHTSINLCAAIQSLSPVDFLSFNISGEALSEIAAFDHSPLCAAKTFFKSTFLWMCQTHKVRTHSNWPSVSPRREKQKSWREDATPAESSINIIPADQKMAYSPMEEVILKPQRALQVFNPQAGHWDRAVTRPFGIN